MTNDEQTLPAEDIHAEFTKWLKILRRLVDIGPTDWGLWQQTREAQEILARLARSLGFERGPIERRKEAFNLTTAQGREEHRREYVIATDPVEPSVAERFDGWISFLDSTPYRAGVVRGGLPDAEFREQVLTRLDRWLEAASTTRIEPLSHLLSDRMKADAYDDDLALQDYIIRNQVSLMTSVEQRAYLFAVQLEKEAPGSDAASQLQQFLASEPDAVRQAARAGLPAVKEQITSRVSRDIESGALEINRCRRCCRIVRTPQAQQCLWCGHDWHKRG